MRFCVINLGCKVNRVESDSYEALLAARGGVAAGPDETPDIVIVNTCTVTGEAEKKTRKAVRGALKRFPSARIIVTGCAAAIAPDAFEGMDARISAVPKAQMEERLAALAGDGTGAATAPVRPGRSRVGVKVQDGCDHACTYCIVHTARGRSRSVAPDVVAAQCQRLLDTGIPEIVLSGINLGSYRASGNGGVWRLADLVRHLLSLEGAAGAPFRLRLSSIEPQDADEALQELLAEQQGRVCRHLHLPLQSGSSRVLRQMARPYDADEYLALVQRIRTMVPQASLTTDIIAGFPGETDADHAETMELCRACGFSKMHVFPYSMRAGTPAAARADQVAPEVKLQRAQQLRELSDALRRADAAARAGTVEDAVVEGCGRACTESYHEVEVDAALQPGAMVPYRFGVQ